METIRALIRGDLAPAGNQIATATDLSAFAYHIVGYHACWVDSGTSALALALADAKRKAPQVQNPKVIIPGYCCPDLVAAAVYAGVRPLAVDIGEADPGYDLTRLKEAIGPDVIAVIAVNFLGIKERLAEIRALLAHTSIKLIEDNAQWFPASSNEHDFVSDYIVFTFGRGKPLSLLGGGVLFSREKIAVAGLVQPLQDDPAHDIRQHGKLLAYNFLLRPRTYCYLNRAPFLHLGETRYHPLEKISALDAYRKSLFAKNLLLYTSRDNHVEQAYHDIFNAGQIQQLKAVDSARRKRLLRYPLLCSRPQQRELLLGKLTSAGLGASPMYQAAISAVAGVDRLLDVAGDLVNARRFADCFLTLPIHQYVSAKHIARIKCLVRESQ